MIKGADISNWSLIEEKGGCYYDKGQKKDLAVLLKDYNFNLLRLRLFNDPFDENGNSYGAGNCDLNGVIEMAKRIKDAGIDWLLDFHYSDCWADPGKQTLPKAWMNLNIDELVQAVYDFTANALKKCKEAHCLPSMVAIGNEITNGLLWPLGYRTNYENVARLVSAGIKATHDVDSSIKTMIHLDNGGNQEIYDDFFDHYLQNHGEDFDYIGLSYYIFWHGSMDALKTNMNHLASKYQKPMIVAETSYVFTDADYQQYEKLPDHLRKGMATKAELLQNLPYPISPAGQSDYMLQLMQIIDSIDNHLCKGFIYWGGELIPTAGVGWASEAGIAYMHEKGPGGNEWANQALFDYEGNSLEVLETIKNY